ncbi:spore germination protein [Alicyclobacillus cycloheptanicus]|uniref:Spore germination protein KA n=1 Tax=Alicyclobacillus cycloheptanicus TaxID=1457 RepID=A0ABT9XK88_9BACL|nr:spore germination protein [Alicyclobacillus cycloheptanicus]MDQ0190721.1 spore germination protein KA [Alicyclobacillus cycloheptanicus]
MFLTLKKRGKKAKDLENHPDDRLTSLVDTSWHQPDEPLPSRLEGLRGWIEGEWQHCDDLLLREVDVHGTRVLLIWLRGLVDLARIEEGVLQPLETLSRRPSDIRQIGSVLHTIHISWIRTWYELNTAVSDGQVVLHVDGSKLALVLDISNPPVRAIEKAENEPTIEGPQEAFIEHLDLNIALLRKRIRSPRLKVESMRIGVYSKTTVCITYIEGIAKPTLVDEARKRLRKISIDGVNDINKLRELIGDAPHTLFPTTEETERPDRVTGSLLQGRISIMLDGAPTSLMVPAQFINFLASAEDYYMNYTLTLFIRILRHIAYWSSLMLPSLYVALLSYNQDLIPTPLLVSVQAQHRGIPFPTILEALVMMCTFEALREAGTRLPRSVGQSVSIVGTLIVGDAAVRAGLVSPGMVIVVSGTGVASFALPAYGFVNSSRIIQFVFVIIAGIFGLVGIVILGLVLVTHLVSLRSFGVPYMAPIAPFTWSDMKDMFIRVPWFATRQRPDQLEPIDRVSNRTPAPRAPNHPSNEDQS